VVLHDGRHDDVVRLEAEPVGEGIDGFGGVAADDGDVVASTAPSEPQRCGARIFVGGRGVLGLPTCAAMHTGVPRQEVVHPVGDGGQRRRRGGGIERDVATLGPVNARDGQVVTDGRTMASLVM